MVVKLKCAKNTNFGLGNGITQKSKPQSWQFASLIIINLNRKKLLQKFVLKELQK